MELVKNVQNTKHQHKARKIVKDRNVLIDIRFLNQVTVKCALTMKLLVVTVYHAKDLIVDSMNI